jgi:hypothetical protein
LEDVRLVIGDQNSRIAATTHRSHQSRKSRAGMTARMLGPALMEGEGAGAECLRPAGSWLRGAIAPITIAGLGAPPRLLPPIRCQRSAALVHLLETSRAGTPREEGRFAARQQRALPGPALGGGPSTALSAPTLCSHARSLSNANATD